MSSAPATAGPKAHPESLRWLASRNRLAELWSHYRGRLFFGMALDFSELFPTHLRATGIGASVGVGGTGAVIGQVLLTSTASILNLTSMFVLLGMFWLIGAAGAVWWRYGIEARGQGLESLAARGRPTPDQQPAALHRSTANCRADAGRLTTARTFTAAEVRSFVLATGPTHAEPVVCLPGVPASSSLVLPGQAGRGLRGVAFDLPGLGFAERPETFDYSWSGLGRWATAAFDALDLDRVHLVIRDRGEPVGFEIAAAAPDPTTLGPCSC